MIYPPVCGRCGKLEENWICNKCNLEFKKYYELKIDNYEEDEAKQFDEHIYIFKYAGIVREELLKYKFKEKSYNYKMFSNFIIKERQIENKLKKYDIIISVPISKKRQKERGYNQSELISKELSKKLQIEYAKKVLYKTTDTVAQSTLNKEQREKNTKGVYEIGSRQKIYNKNILLVDDIFTTGSTVNECSKILRQVGARKIGILTIAKD